MIHDPLYGGRPGAIILWNCKEAVDISYEAIPLQDSGKVLIQRGILYSCSKQSAANLMRIRYVHKHCGKKQNKKNTTSHTSFYVIISKLYTI